jgi:putative acetyltransferase
MPSNAQIRLASPEDATDIADVLRQSFLEFEALYTPQGFAATTPDEPEVAGRMQEGPMWVAVWKDRIVGTASAVLTGEKGSYVRGVAVVPSARGLGIAESLMNQVESFARQHGCTRLFLTTTPFLTSAVRLYQRLGFALIPDGTAALFGTPLLKMEKVLGRS